MIKRAPSKADGVPLRVGDPVGRKGAAATRPGCGAYWSCARFAEKSMFGIPLHRPAAGGAQPVAHQRRGESWARPNRRRRRKARCRPASGSAPRWAFAPRLRAAAAAVTPVAAAAKASLRLATRSRLLGLPHSSSTSAPTCGAGQNVGRRPPGPRRHWARAPESVAPDRRPVPASPWG